MSVISDFINIASKEIGYKETGINITKYNEWADEKGIWFTKVQGLAWCTSFVAWCIYKLAPKYSWKDNPFCIDFNSCWSDHWMYNFKEGGRLYTTPEVGDLAFKNGHVGIVVAFNPRSDLVQVIEGNVGNSVNREWYPLTHWLGFGRPYWDFFKILPVQESETTSAKEFVSNNGIYIGRGDGEMHWEDNLTREEMALILYRYWRKFNK